MQWRLIFTLILMVLVVIFSLTNAAPVKVYFFGEQKISLALIIIVSALAGAIAGVLAGLGRQIKLNRLIEENEAKLRRQQRLIDKIKSDEVADEPAIYDQRSDHSDTSN